MLLQVIRCKSRRSRILMRREAEADLLPKLGSLESYQKGW